MRECLKHWRGMVAASVLTSLALLAGTSTAGGKRSDAEVKVAATATKLDQAGNQTVTITMAINKGWHIYANPVANEELSAAQTVVTIGAKVKPALVKVMYPQGKIHADKTIGDYKTYEDKITIQASVQRAAGDTSPLEVSVRFMACDSKNCLLPATVKLMVP